MGDGSLKNLPPQYGGERVCWNLWPKILRTLIVNDQMGPLPLLRVVMWSSVQMKAKLRTFLLSFLKFLCLFCFLSRILYATHAARYPQIKEVDTKIQKTRNRKLEVKAKDGSWHATSALSSLKNHERAAHQYGTQLAKNRQLGATIHHLQVEHAQLAKNHRHLEKELQKLSADLAGVYVRERENECVHACVLALDLRLIHLP